MLEKLTATRQSPFSCIGRKAARRKSKVGYGMGKEKTGRRLSDCAVILTSLIFKIKFSIEL